MHRLGLHRSQTALPLLLLILGLILPLTSRPLPPAAVHADSPDDRSLELFRQRHEELHREFADSLQELVAFCEKNDLPEAARRLRKLAEPLDPQVLRVETLPREVQPEIPPDLPADERSWRVRLRFRQKEYAKNLYRLSRQALHAGHPSFAFRLVREVAHHDPDHKWARRLLGYVQYAGEWVTPFEAHMRRTDHVRHETFGWLPKAHVERYENGQRYFRGRWISAAQEAELRRDFDNAWEVRTAHYLVKTNHSLKRGVQIARALEEFSRVFRQTFAAFFNTPEQLRKRFRVTSNDPRRGRISRPYRVHYYRTREEYNRRLADKIPQITITNGLYYTPDRTAYFFHTPERDNLPTIYHEASHQLFYESSARDREIGKGANFWVVEGIACYVESFQQEEGGHSLGDPSYVRFRAARHRYFQDGYYVPLAHFARMGRQQFQNSPNISKNYSQASGLAHFFMHYDGGRYRDALIEHLKQLYSVRRRVRRNPDSLAELTGVGFAELDRQYKEHLQQMHDAQ